MSDIGKVTIFVGEGDKENLYLIDKDKLDSINYDVIREEDSFLRRAINNSNISHLDVSKRLIMMIISIMQSVKDKKILEDIEEQIDKNFIKFGIDGTEDDILEMCLDYYEFSRDCRDRNIGRIVEAATIII